MVTATPNELALREAAWNANSELVRVLLQRYRAHPNATSNTGLTPLMEECDNPHACVEVVRLLLEAGADPALASENGENPLHKAAVHGRRDLVDMLYSRAPATLNRCMANGETALYVACCEGHEGMVSKLLSLGAMQPTPLGNNRRDVCPLGVAVATGCVGVVRILIKEGGIRAVGGEEALTAALFTAVQFRQAIILSLLLTVGGEKGWSEWTNSAIRSKRLLHYAAAYSYPAAVSVLLNAGADVAANDKVGRTARDDVGVCVDRVCADQINPGDGVAIRRMLDRGPAYRARSWAWPLDDKMDAGSRGDDDRDTASVAVADVLWSWLAMAFPPVVCFCVCRPKEKNKSSKIFVTLIGRYSAKA